MVYQVTDDYSADELLRVIDTELTEFIINGKMKKEKCLPLIVEADIPHVVPNDWRWVRLGNVCRLINGELRTNIKLPYLEAKVYRGGKKPIYIDSGEYVQKDTCTILVDGENSGETFIAPTDGYLGSTFRILQISSAIYVPYALKFITLHNRELKSSKTGSAIPHLNKKLFNNLLLPLPKISEQKKIVAALDKVFLKLDEIKGILEKQLLNAEEMIQSYLNSLLSNESSKWPEVTLDEYVQFIDYRGRTPEKTKNGVRLITAKNVRMGFLKYEPAEFIAAEDYDEWMRRGIPEYGDVIFTTEAPLANVAQINTHEKLAFAQRIIVMHPDTSVILQDFLKYLLLSQSIRNKIFDKESGATVTGIKAKLLKKIEIPVPEISVQKEIVNKLDKAVSHINSLKESYSHKLTCVEELRKSILNKAFRGELLK